MPGGRPVRTHPSSLMPSAVPVRSGVGLPSWWLERAGLVVWSDLFDGNGEVRDFDQVVRSKGLTVAQLLGAGSPRRSPAGRSGWGRWGSDALSFMLVPATRTAADNPGGQGRPRDGLRTLL